MDLKLYEYLGVDKNCSFHILKAAYRSKLLQYHPDKNGQEQSYDEFLQLRSIWSVLGSKEFRKQYDLDAKREATRGINAERMNISEFELVKDADGELFWSKPCRCGDSYTIFLSDLTDTNETVTSQCNGCSLYVEVCPDLE